MPKFEGINRNYNTDKEQKKTPKEDRDRMMQEFLAKGGKVETARPTQIVASANQSAQRSIKPGRKTVKLTPSQVAIAKKLNVPLEDYAKQLHMKEV